MSTSAKEYLAIANKKYEVTLPSGALFLIRRPNAFWFASNIKSLPTAAITQAAAQETVIDNRSVSQDEIDSNVSMTDRMVCDHVLQPKLRRNADPAKDEVDFDSLLPEDAEFILAYLVGKVDKDGQPVATFSKQ